LALALAIAAAACDAEKPGLTVGGAVVAAPVVDGPAALYLTITNPGRLPDTLVSVTGPDGRAAEIHRQLPGTGLLSQMEPVAFLEIPGDSAVAMRPGGTHLMLDEGAGPLLAGDTIEIELTFRRAGTRTAAAVVVGYAELQQKLATEVGP